MKIHTLIREDSIPDWGAILGFEIDPQY